MGTYQNNPATPKRKKRKKTSQGDWGGFIDCAMGKEERLQFGTFLEKSKIPVFDQMQTLLDREINVSMGYSEKDGAYLAKATQVNEEDGKRYMLSAFHSDVETAWQLLFFKDIVLLGENWFPDETATKDGDNWG